MVESAGISEESMNLQTLNKICFTVCIVCIATGIVISLGLIWFSHDDDVLWKGLGTVGVVFAGAALTLSVSRTLGGKPRQNSPND
jgi:hypothetical protein